MANNIQEDLSRFNGEAKYRIVVKGTVPESWADRLAGMEITSGKKGEPQQRSTLEGILRDQSELNGVLETLYRLQLTIVSVEQLKN